MENAEGVTREILIKIITYCVNTTEKGNKSCEQIIVTLKPDTDGF